MIVLPINVCQKKTLLHSTKGVIARHWHLQGHHGHVQRAASHPTTTTADNISEFSDFKALSLFWTSMSTHST